MEKLEQRMRAQDVPIIGRIERDRLLIDMRTIREEEELEVTAGIKAALEDENRFLRLTLRQRQCENRRRPL